MLIRCALLILFLNCVRSTGSTSDGTDIVSDFNRRFSFWPSVHNAARLMRVRREDPQISPSNLSEGDINVRPEALSPTTTTQAPQPAVHNESPNNDLKDQAQSKITNLSPSGISSGPSNRLPGSTNATTASSDANLASSIASPGSGINSASAGIDSKLNVDKSSATDAKPKETDAKPGDTDGTSGKTDAKPGNTDATPGKTDAKPGKTDATPGKTDAKTGNTDATPGKTDAKPGTAEAIPASSNTTATSSGSVVSGPLVPSVLNATDNSTSSVMPTKPFDLNDPGVVKRGFIVFGGFALLAVAYYIFYYRRKNKNNTSGTTHSLMDTNQFRYGVLQSEDKRDTELSRVPLTMESDDEEEEDLEIFDLEQKKKSLSYVNLQTNDEDVVFSLNNQEDDRGDLLLDIEDGNSDTLINWSSTGNNKSIL